jgi:hypothetical protein
MSRSWTSPTQISYDWQTFPFVPSTIESIFVVLISASKTYCVPTPLDVKAGPYSRATYACIHRSGWWSKRHVMLIPYSTVAIRLQNCV